MKLTQEKLFRLPYAPNTSKTLVCMNYIKRMNGPIKLGHLASTCLIFFLTYSWVEDSLLGPS